MKSLRTLSVYFGLIFISIILNIMLIACDNLDPLLKQIDQPKDTDNEKIELETPPVPETLSPDLIGLWTNTQNPEVTVRFGEDGTVTGYSVGWGVKQAKYGVERNTIVVSFSFIPGALYYSYNATQNTVSVGSSPSSNVTKTVFAAEKPTQTWDEDAVWKYTHAQSGRTQTLERVGNIVTITKTDNKYDAKTNSRERQTIKGRVHKQTNLSGQLYMEAATDATIYDYKLEGDTLTYGGFSWTRTR